MKKTLLFACLMLLAFQGFSQKKRRTKKSTTEKKEMIADDDLLVEEQEDLPIKYRAIFLGVGPRSLNTDPGTILTSFTDDSPSMDNLQTTTEVADNYSNVGFQLGFKFGRYKGLSHAITVDIALGDVGGGLVTYGLGYSIPKLVNNKMLVIRPSIIGGFGNYWFGVGALENNAGYIQIGDTQYYDDKLDVKLRSQVLVYGPQLDLYYMVFNKIDAYMSINYDFGSKNQKPKLEFTTPNDDGPSSELAIDGDNPSVTYNDEKLTTLPYTVSGLRFTVGISYVWNRY